MKANFTTTVLMALTCLMLVNSVSAAGIGAGPSTINYGKLVPGGYSEEEITVSTSGEEDLDCTVEFTGDLADWINIDKGMEFVLPANTRYNIKSSLQPPLDAAPGKYEGRIIIKSAPKQRGDLTGSGAIVGAGVVLKVSAEITDEEIVSYRLVRASVADAEIGYQIKFQASVLNTGNVKVKPEIKIDIYDKSGNLKKSYTQANVEVLPTVQTAIPIMVSSEGLGVDEYKAIIHVGQDEQTLIFNILERGTLALKGVLRKIALNKIWVEVGETVKIMGEVENTGEVLIQDAKLGVEVYLVDERYQTEKLVKAFTSSESLDIPVGSKVELSTYFTPTKAGRYMVRGSAQYSGKKTPSKASVLNVLPTPTNYTPYIIVATIVIIAVVVYLTRKGEDGRTRRFKKIWGDYLQLK